MTCYMAALGFVVWLPCYSVAVGLVSWTEWCFPANLQTGHEIRFMV